ncbi:hypothetical protein R3P38DRAFT_3331167 [Favolaschia claudopus]|uniref:Uncharacterized protein n=1 Tax=Favolaschia claudopus TaxID=2862362 RepID=A0AAV9ZU77_9AGAR
MSASAIDELMQNWAARDDAADPPFANHKDLYATIDATSLGHIPWQSFEVSYNQPIPLGDTVPWKRTPYKVFFRDPRLVLQRQPANPDFKDDIDYVDLIAQLPKCMGATFVPAILGSDKTTVSVATGQNEYYPLYISNGLVHNNVRRAHGDSVTLIGFLAIWLRTELPDREPADSSEFRTFRRNLFHGSVRHILVLAAGNDRTRGHPIR